MGHLVNFKEFSEDTSEKKMYLHSQEWCSFNVDREENPSGSYYNEWIVHKGILSDREEAENFLESKGAYVDGCVKFKAADTTSKKYLKLKERRDSVLEKYRKFETANDVKKRKSNLIGCTNCGSKIAKDFLKTNNCPVCREDMRSETVKNKVKEYHKKLNKIDKQLKEAAKSNKPVIKWLVKTEVHC